VKAADEEWKAREASCCCHRHYEWTQLKVKLHSLWMSKSTEMLNEMLHQHNSKKTLNARFIHLKQAVLTSYATTKK